MDFAALNRGEKIAGVAGILLILIMFIFNFTENFFDHVFHAYQS